MKNKRNPFKRNLNNHLNYYVGVVFFYALINNTTGEGLMAFIILYVFAFLLYLLVNTLPQANPKFIPTKRAGLVLYVARFLLKLTYYFVVMYIHQKLNAWYVVGVSIGYVGIEFLIDYVYKQYPSKLFHPYDSNEVVNHYLDIVTDIQHRKLANKYFAALGWTVISSFLLGIAIGLFLPEVDTSSYHLLISFIIFLFFWLYLNKKDKKNIK